MYTNHRELLKTIISKLTGILGDLEDIETCPQCSRPAVARGLCSKHYSRWRRDYCKERQIKRLRDQTEAVEPDPRQTKMFVEQLDSIIEF